MDTARHIDGLEQLRALADPQRMTILRHLMAQPSTLSQLGAAMDRHPAWIRHHLKSLEAVGLVELDEERKTRGYVEKFYRASARAYAVNLMVFPQPGERGQVIVVGSDDLALDLLAENLRHDRRAPEVLTLALGSLEGLIALRQGLGHAAGCHLLDAASGEYNLPHARHLFPDRELVCVTLAHRQQGLLLPAGNPRAITGLAHAVEQGATVVNRNQGSGTRILMDTMLGEAGIEAAGVRGYATEVSTHSEVACAVVAGRADAGLGIFAAAMRFGLAFVPISQERYDLVIPREHRDGPLMERVVEHINAPSFKRAVERLGGYETSHSGEERPVAA